MSAALQTITSKRVQSNHRMGALPRAFGRYMLHVESAVYDSMGELDSSYSGGYWEFQRLSNGGFFMHPDGEPRELSSPNGWHDTVSAEAAGIIACLFAYSNLSFRFPQSKQIADNYHLLRDFAGEHAEASAIFAAID